MARKSKQELTAPEESRWLPLFLEFVSHLSIDSKESGVGPLELYGSQRRFLAELIEGLERDVHLFVNLKAMQLGVCLDPSHRVLTAALTWKKISDLKIGDELIATDEFALTKGKGNDRKMRTCRVQAVAEVYEPAVRLTMDDGRVLVATPHHRFLARLRGGKATHWREVQQTRVGDFIRYITHPWSEDYSYEDGWMSGILDGEGSMRQKERAGVECCMCQVPGEVLERARSYFSERAYSYREEIDNNPAGEVSKLGNTPVHKLVIGRMFELFRLIGQTRPSRFIGKRWWEGKSLPGKKVGLGWSCVESIERLPARRMIDLQTSTKTFIVEGFVSHNSTLVLAVDLFWLAVHPGMQGLLLTDTDGNRQKFRVILKRFLASLPKSYSMKIAKGGDNREHMVFENGSVLDFIAAGTRMTSTEVGRSRAYNFVHACMAPGTPVITEHGRIKPIEDVKIGDKVLTHTGAATTVIDVVGQPNTKGPMLRITPWRGQSVICTRDHTIPTQRGVIEAKDLCKDDLLVMPVRTISGGGHTVQLQATRAAVSPQVNRKKSWKRLAAAGAELTISMTEEVGFAIGYYLAEGHLLHASTNGYPCGITFTRHRNEKAYADRAIAALQPFTTGHRKTVDRTTCLTSVDTIYGTPLAKWIDDTFGCVAEKRIPDDVFGWGVEFCRGLLAGLLCGDGSKTSSKTKSPTKRKPGGGGKYIFKTRARAKLGVTYPTNLVVMPTTRSSLATQARDIAASLGFGWGAISYKAGGDHYGRICKPCWRITWSGSAAFKLRALMGLPEIQRAGKDNIEKYTINDGFVYLKIRKIEKGIIESEMWDISVDHEDHTFRTPHMAVGNTEIANYGAVEGVASLIDRLAEKHPDRLYIFESTAKGYNLFWKLWQKAKSDPISQKAFFIGWWAKEDYSIPEDDPRFAQYWDGDVFVEEQDRVNNVWEKYGVRITPSQIAWYRWKCEQSSDPTLIDQNFPWDEEDAFLQTGQTFFPIKRTVALVNSLTENPPPFKGYAYEFAEKFMDTKIRSVRSADDAHLKIYEEPSDIGQYAMGVDPAYGRSENKDLSCIEIYRCYADRLVQVAEFATSDTESYQVAWVMAHLAGAYKNVMMIVEINGPGGATVNEIKHLRELFEAGLLPTPGNGSIEDIFGGARWFMFHRADSPGPGYSYNWKTSQDLTLTAMNELRDSFTTGLIEVRSIQCALEIQSMVQDGFRIQPALSTSKDDRVFGSMFAHRAWAEWIRPGMIGDMLTYERVRNMEAGRSEGDHDSMISFVISDFFQRKDDERDEQEIEDAWE